MIETGVFMGVATIKRCSIEKMNTLNAKLSSFTVSSKAQLPGLPPKLTTRKIQKASSYRVEGDIS